MTLSTYLYVHGPVQPREFLAELRRNLALYDEDGRTPEQHEDLGDSWSDGPNVKTIGNRIGQGLPAILLLTYCPDGPLVTPEQAAEHDSDCNLPSSEWYEPEAANCDGSSHDPACTLKVNWDTTYGYTNPQVGGCANLHARLITHAGQWLDARGVDWSWRNEFTGEIHHKYDGLQEFIGSGDEARSWFTNTVLPAIAAQIGG